MQGALKPSNISTKQQRIAELASRQPKMALMTLAHHIDVDWLREAFNRTRKDGAAGIDGLSAEEYAMNLEANLASLLDRLKTGMYWAPPVRRVDIPKGDGTKTRPIGIPTIEDKVLQRAVLMVLEPVYEQDFLPCSYGFRPGRSAHQAVQALWQGMMRMGGGYVIELDIESFFDTVNHEHLRSFLDQRVVDGVVRRAIGKWLNAGVLSSGAVTRDSKGTPQGGVISPLLANIYLHEVLDVWFEDEVKPRMRGACFMVRYADDAVLVFSNEADARGVLDVLPKRFSRYDLKLHPEKTRMLKFTQPDDDSDRESRGKGETFDFLGFTHHWKKSREGKWIVGRRTSGSRFARTAKRISLWCRQNRHLPMREQHAHLSMMLRGHDAYFGITGNVRSLADLREAVRHTWRKWLSRRSQRGTMTWERFTRYLQQFPLPRARAVHSIYRTA